MSPLDTLIINNFKYKQHDNEIIWIIDIANTFNFTFNYKWNYSRI